MPFPLAGAGLPNDPRFSERCYAVRWCAMNTYKLYWSPTGQEIATVRAKTTRAAIRKAPAPYRKFLGEIYAVVQS